MAKIYNDFQSANLMSFAKSFARLNGQPLDKSEIWYNLAEAQAYAATDAAYVGQILAVIDSDNNKVVFYGIQDAAGTLTEVGSAPVGDNLSIEIVDGAVQLKNFGKGYYKYVPAVKDETSGEITTPSSYEYIKEDFIAGLEPRVVLNDNGDLEIAWYEPSEETIDGVNAKVESVSNTVGALEEIINAEGGLVDQVDELQEQIGTAADDAGNEATGLYAEIERIDEELATKANADDVYTKEAADEAVATAIGEAIANVDHLKREVVDVLPAVADADANTIYMVPSGLLEDDNKYYEWILINGVFEQVGSWEVDLSSYAKKEDLTNLSNTVSALTQTVADNKTAAEQAIADEKARAEAAEQANATAIEGKADKGTTLTDYGITDAYTKDEVYNKDETYTKSEVNAAIADAVKDATGGESASAVLADLNAYKKAVNAEVWGNADLTDDALTSTPSRIDALEEAVDNLTGAEANYVSSVDDANFVVIDGQLQLNSNAGRLINSDEIATLEAVKNGNFDNFIKSVNEDIFSVSEVGNLDLIAIPSSLLEPVIGDMSDLVTYDVDNPTTIVNELNNIYQMLTWTDMQEATE